MSALGCVHCTRMCVITLGCVCVIDHAMGCVCVIDHALGCA